MEQELTKPPIFIIGANRSGTTLLRLILNAHSRITIPEEIEYFQHFKTKEIVNWRNPQISAEVYRSLVQIFLDKNSEILSKLDIEQLKNLIYRDMSALNLKQPYKVVLETLANHCKKERWGEKSPGNLFFIDVLLDMFPNAKFIHIIRDPRAVVCSMNEPSFHCFPEDSVINAINLNRMVSQALHFFQKTIPTHQKMIVKYEHLVTCPEEVIMGVCKFIDEPYERNMLNFYLESKNHMKLSASTIFNVNATQPVNEENKAKWKSKLSQDEVSAIELICYRQMKEFDYEFLSNPFSSLKVLPKVLIALIAWNYHSLRHYQYRSYLVNHNFFMSTNLLPKLNIFR